MEAPFCRWGSAACAHAACGGRGQLWPLPAAPTGLIANGGSECWHSKAQG